MSGLSHPARIAEREPDRIAYVMAADGNAISCGELEARSNRLARYWRAIDLRVGDTVAFVADNSVWVFPLVWSAQRSGLYHVMISTGLSAADMAYIVNDSGASAVVVSPITAPRVAPAQAQIASARMPPLDEALAAAAELTPEPADDESAGIDMLYSSGTTGWPSRRPDVLPRQPTGKLYKRLLRDPYRMDA